MGRFGGMELLLILLVVLLLFGAKRLPDLSRSLGRSLRILKSETKALHADDDDEPRRADGAGEADRRPLASGATGAGDRTVADSTATDRTTTDRAATGRTLADRAVADDSAAPVRAPEPRDAR